MAHSHDTAPSTAAAVPGPVASPHHHVMRGLAGLAAPAAQALRVFDEIARVTPGHAVSRTLLIRSLESVAHSEVAPCPEVPFLVSHHSHQGPMMADDSVRLAGPNDADGRPPRLRPDDGDGRIATDRHRVGGRRGSSSASAPFRTPASSLGLLSVLRPPSCPKEPLGVPNGEPPGGSPPRTS